MVRNIVVLAGNSHPQLADTICNYLNVPAGNRILGKFSGGESRCEIKDSVRGKDVFIIQTGGGAVNDHLVDLCIMISACKTGSAKRVTAVTPLFPYSRQPDLPYRKAGAPLSRPVSEVPAGKYTFESVPATPGPGTARSATLTNGGDDLDHMLSKTTTTQAADPAAPAGRGHAGSVSATANNFTTHDYEKNLDVLAVDSPEAKPGYKRWVAQAGTLIADLLTCAGADHVVALDLHDAQYQGFFDVPMDNLYGRPLLKRYIQTQIPDFRDAVIVSPDAGGAKRATAIADALGMDFALVHKERRPLQHAPAPADGAAASKSATMMLVGAVEGRVCIMVDDLADTANTITRAAKLLRRKGATTIYALLTHGVFSGDALARISASAIDKVVVTNSVPQEENRLACAKIEVLDVAPVFSEAIRRIHHGESLSTLFQHD